MRKCHLTPLGLDHIYLLVFCHFAPVESTTLEKDYVSKLVNKELLPDITRKKISKQQLFPKSWQFKYNKMMMLRVNSELLGLASE